MIHLVPTATYNNQKKYLKLYTAIQLKQKIESKKCLQNGYTNHLNFFFY